MKIGEYRLKLYELLYQHPLCRYRTADRREMNVLILGNGWIGNEAFKAVFWAGQYPDSALNLTVASRDADRYADALYRGLPALASMTESGEYASLRFLRIPDMDAADGLEALEIAGCAYTCVIVALGDTARNFRIACRIRDAAEEAGYLHPYIIHVYDDGTDGGSLPENEPHLNFFGRGGMGGDLMRQAKNINFSYDMVYNQRIPRAESDRKFDEEYRRVFEAGQTDSEDPDVIVRNFTGTSYNVDSSYASAVHIPAKLEYCREYGEAHGMTGSEYSILVGTLSDREGVGRELYGTLIALEHRRWAAFMAMWAYRAPADRAELDEYLYKNGNDQRVRDPSFGRLLHACMCGCGTDGLTLDKKYHLWKAERIPAELSELDRVSLYCHRAADRIAKTLEADFRIPLPDAGKDGPPLSVKNYLEERKSRKPEYADLQRSILKLFADDDNSVKLYTEAMRAAQEVSEEEDLRKLKAIDKALGIVKIRNNKVDFLANDAQLIAMLPFCIWYGRDYRTVLTVSDGVPAQDVVVPTLLCAERAVFFCDSENPEAYRRIVTAYFRGRGGTTVPEFYPLTIDGISSVYDALKRQIDTSDAPVLNIVPHKKAEAALAIGTLLNEYRNRLPVVQYHRTKGIVSYMDNSLICSGLNNKSFSIEEFIALAGGRYANVYDTSYTVRDSSELLEVFRENHMHWGILSNMFSSAAGDVSFETKAEKKNAAPSEEAHFSGTMTRRVYAVSRAAEFLQQLERYRILHNCRTEKEEHGVSISFDSVDAKLIGLFAELCSLGEDAEDIRRLKFTPKDGIQTYTLFAERVPVCAGKDDKPENVEYRKSFLETIRRKGMIRNLEYHTDEKGEYVSFRFPDEYTRSLFRTQGSLFETLLYRSLKDSGMFDDVEIGAKITLNSAETDFEELLLNSLNEEKNAYGYTFYRNRREQLKKEVEFSDDDPYALKNELDVLVTSGMNTVLVSCKTNRQCDKKWIYEIAALSGHFGSAGVLAVLKDIRSECERGFVSRSQKMGVSLLGKETIFDRNILPDTFRRILNGEIVVTAGE